MERKIGEVFKYGEICLKVIPSPFEDCGDCYFSESSCHKIKELGKCTGRDDGCDVKFVEVSSEDN